MRSDCVDECYQDKMKNLCKIDHGILMSKSLIRKDNFNYKYDKMRYCYVQEYDGENFNIRRYCNKMCKVECKEKYYVIESDRIDSEDNDIFIEHSENPDIYIKHIPEMNFIRFLCDLGGLLGMWLGLSLFDIFKGILIIFKKNY